MPDFQLPIRIRLTFWYVFLLAITFGLLGTYLFFRFQNSLRSTIDHSLDIAVSRTIAALDQDDFQETGQLSFDIVGRAEISPPGFAMRLLSSQGDVWDTFGQIQRVSDWGQTGSGYTTQKGNLDEDDQWRILTQPMFDSNHQIVAWVQAAQSLVTINETLQDLQEQMLLAIPLILIFAGFGGYFLADRALRPIDHITKAAQQITAQDLSSRLAYQGMQDEVGRLAQTFDQMLERLQASFERERRFTSDAAHELRTPLTVLRGQIEVVLNRSRQPAEYQEKLRELSAEVNRLIRLSNALLFLSRSDQNQILFERKRIDLKELLEVLAEQIQPLAQEKKIRLESNLQNDVYTSGDHDHLVRLFMNLFENALKFTPPGGVIRVNAENRSDFCDVFIHNSGSEIPAEHLPHLFERFYRADDDRSSQTGGSGLGLAIAHEIVRLHGGRISAQNGSGGGVTFTVRLPTPIK